jgi:tetratricopeptide (TPR) repeat protein
VARTDGQPPEEPERPPERITRSELSGSAGNVVQAGSVGGGVHFHQTGNVPTPLPRQLPGGVRGFVDRHTESRQLDAVLFPDETDPPSVSMAIIAGTAGVGKTTFALHWAHQAQDHFPDGQLYVNLRGYDPGEPVSPRQALERFLVALGVSPQAIPADVDASAALYRSLLAGRRMLIVLDNAATAAQVRPLLPGTPGCLVLVTSRSRLSGLVAREGAHRVTLGMLREDDAVELLRVVTAGYRTQDDPAKLAELARLCARLPLALRIAAERAASRPWMHLDELIADLRNESALWDALTAQEGDGEGDAVRTVFAWSYRALPAETARLFRLLGLHPGAEFGVPVVAAMAGMSRASARNRLDTLVGAHLLENDSPGRYQFHDLLRSYATDQAQLEETPESRLAVLRRALDWYLRTADEAQSLLNPGEAHVPLGERDHGVEPLRFTAYDDALHWYETERANFVTATRAAAANGLHDIAWRLAVVLRAMYMRFNPFEDWIVTSTIGLESARRLGDRAAEAELLESLGMAYTQSHRLREGLRFHTAALDIRRELEDRRAETLSLNAIGLIHLRNRDLAAASAMFDACVTIFRDLGDAYWEAVAAVNLAEIRAERGMFAEARPLVRHALGVFREHGEKGGEGNALRVLSMIDRGLGDVDAALDHARQAVAIARERHNPMWEGYWLIELGTVQRARGVAADALVAFQRAAQLHRELGDLTREARAWNGAGEVYRDMGRPADAIDFHRRAAAVHRELDDRWHLAVALHGLALAQGLAGEARAAEETRRQALDALADFDDPVARAMRSRLLDAP